jgi:RecB family exonuclease
VITPRRTRLVRVPDLRSFRRAIAALARSGGLVVVPNRAAARINDVDGDARLVTRDELYDELHARLANPPRRLTPLERDVVAQAAARAAASRHPDLGFTLRPGLVAEMLRFYDQLRRQSQQVKRFEELIDEALGGEDLDRAARRMRAQTRFLADAFREYERLAAASSGCDEHMLRDRLIAEAAAAPVRGIVVTVGDWIADADGLFAADFDLLTRIPGLETLDVVATEQLLASGLQERLERWLPGVQELGIGDSGLAGFGDERLARPSLVCPPAALHDQSPATSHPNPQSPIPNPHWVHRDRDEELASIARLLATDARAGEASPLERTAIVFKHPLPYLYAAADVFGAAGIPYRAYDALPLASEPTAAALDLALDAVAANFTRATLVALLRSPHFVFRHDGVQIERRSISALDRLLSEARYLGEIERLQAVPGAEPALHAAIAAARELAPLADARPASAQLSLLRSFWTSHLGPIDPADALGERGRRARAAIDDLLSALARLHAAYDDPSWTIADLTTAVHRAIEEHTFAPDADGAGVRLLDDDAARYGDFDTVAIVGLVEPDWPEKPRRNIFYPPSVLSALGWPSEKDRRAADDARFLDLVASAGRRTIVSTFTLENDALVSPSPLLDEIPRARLSALAAAPPDDARVFDEDALSLDPPMLDAIEPDARAWAQLRIDRSPADRPEFHGTVRATAERAWSVSAIETYLDCPFKFFAQHVLKLQEEPDDEEVMDPRRQGRFVHEVFERFFHEWQASGRRAITPADLDAARELFAEVVDRSLERLPAAEAGLERTRLLGSPAAAGLGEAVFRMEAERPVAVVERLLEARLDGSFTFAAAGGARTIPLRGKADRLDLLEDGTFRLIDYKLGWPPNRARALQLPIYALCAEQTLASHHGRSWRLREAAYLAFKGPRRVVPLFTTPADRTRVLAEAQQRLADAVDAIARGEFPPTPDDVFRCETCTFASVCRRDYVGDV